MRFHLGSVPETPEFSPDANWKPLRELTPMVMQFYAFPIGLVSCAAVGALWLFLTPFKVASFDFPGTALVICFVLIPIHELIHAAFHPHAGMSADSILGFWPSRLLAYAHYAGELSRCRFITILLMPLLILSFLPLFVCALFGLSSGLLVFTSLLNALCACGDVLGAGLLLVQVPANAIVRNQGWRTYWKVRNVKAG